MFVPRELKAQPVHPIKEHKPEAKPEKPKETVRRAEAVTPESDLKPTKDEATTKKVAKTEPSSEKSEKSEKAPAKEKSVAEKTEKAAAKEKSVAAKTQAPADDIVTIKVEKPTVAKEPPKTAAKAEPPKTVAKAEPSKEKKDKTAPSKNYADGELPTIKIEKAITAKTEGVKVETVTSKPEKPTVTDHPATVAASKTLKIDKVPAKDESKVTKKEQAKPETAVAKAEKPAPAKDEAKVSKTEKAKPEVTIAKTEKPAPAKDKEKASKTEQAKTEVAIAKSENPAPAKDKEKVTAKPQPTKSEAFIAKNEPPPVAEGPSQVIPAMSTSLDMGLTKIADGFDFPVGKPEAEGYYKARGFRPGGHVGEDWDGVRGGDTDLGDPIYCAGDGIVVFARDVHLGWGNVIIVRHAYRDGGNVKYIDSLYGHLQKMLVGRGQRVSRGQQIATMGTAHGQYDAHLHFEIRRNLEIGMSRSKFQKDFSNYYDPTQFINSHRHLSGGGANYKVAMNTFTHDWMFHFDKNRDFGSRRRGTSESSAALRRALTSARN
ncbi:MAG TPA: peptidoglycan DD-metalloendopeptidase family protein [Chthoniobacterales bacterium]|nr:peptidoglycan DD-metalloendopeptidase family protein [Chthoniobacterales bacterium]